MKRTKKFLINGSILTITNIIMRSIGMVFGIYVSNKIGSEAVGTFDLVMSVYMLAITIATSGLNIACISIVSEQFAKKDFLNGLTAVKTCITFAILLGLSSSIILFLFSDFIIKNWLNNIISSIPLYLIALGLPFIAISSVLNGYFVAVRKAYKGAISQFFEITIKIICTIIFFNFFSLKNVENICICLILADVISEIASCLLWIILYKIDKSKLWQRTKNKISFTKKIIKITVPVFITSCLRSGLSTFKKFIIPIKLVAYGFPYTIALSEYGKIIGMAFPIIMIPNMCISSFSNLLVPEFASLLANGNKKRIINICNKLFKITSIFSITLIIIFMHYSNEISLTLFHNLECSNYIRILSPLILFMCLDNIADNILKGLDKQFEVMLYNVIYLIITIIILYFLIPFIGIGGIIIALYVSEIFNFSASYLELYKKVFKNF